MQRLYEKRDKLIKEVQHKLEEIKGADELILFSNPASAKIVGLGLGHLIDINQDYKRTMGRLIDEGNGSTFGTAYRKQPTNKVSASVKKAEIIARIDPRSKSVFFRDKDVVTSQKIIDRKNVYYSAFTNDDRTRELAYEVFVNLEALNELEYVEEIFNDCLL